MDIEAVAVSDPVAVVRRHVDPVVGLADWQAEAFFLRHAENLPIHEISRRTDRSADAVRSGLYRVKRLLVRAGALEPESEAP
jgi:DNA-directed RNA polymerase specialized sigma24 family protein